MSQEATTWILLALIVALLIWNMTRRRRTGNTNLDGVMGVLANVDNDLKIMEDHLANPQSKKKFQTSAWKYYKSRLGFLGTEVNAALEEAFALADDFNSRIDIARKNKAPYSLQDMPMEKLRVPLTRGREGLVTWLKNSSDQDRGTTRRGCLGF